MDKSFTYRLSFSTVPCIVHMHFNFVAAGFPKGELDDRHVEGNQQVHLQPLTRLVLSQAAGGELNAIDNITGFSWSSPSQGGLIRHSSQSHIFWLQKQK